MNVVRHAWRLAVRDPRRTAAAAAGVAIAVALLTSVILFGAASATTATRRALAEVAVDGQAVLAPGSDPSAVTATLAADPAVSEVLPFDLAQFDTAVLSKAGAATQTSRGVVVGIDPDYRSRTGLFSVSQGAPAPGALLMGRDLASNLGATVGDTVELTLPGGQTVRLPVSGIVDTTGADLVLGPTDAAHRAASPNPPANVAVTDRATWESIARLIPAGAVAAPAPGQPAAGTGPVLGQEPAVRRELHLRYDRSALPGDPVDAQNWLDTVRRRLERTGAGTFTIADDAAASLAPVASDLVWGRVLFVFLALPGVGLALALSRFAAESGSDASRRHAGLLRARGATARQLVATFAIAAALAGGLGALVGVAAGLGLAQLLFGVELRIAGPSMALIVLVALAALGATALATLTATWPLRDLFRGEVAARRIELERVRSPLWQRLYLDVLALAGAVVVYWLVAGAGVHPVLTAEGNPTVSLALTSFLAPLLLWTGGSLLLLRLLRAAVARTDLTTRLLRRPFGPGGMIAARSLAARSRSATRAIVLLALAVSFATSILVFDATYRQQQRVDAALTLGADLKAVPTQTADRAATATVQGGGVAAATPVASRVVYVGSEAQDLLAIDPGSLPSVAALSNGFFRGITAAQAMDLLAAQPDAILVSEETARDYSIVPGDRIRIRIADASGQLREVDFRMAGVVLEFPTAPRDAFLVANLDYVAAQSGDPRIAFVLARTTDAGAAAAVRSRLDGGWTVTDLTSTNARLANTVTSVDLQALVLLDVAFAVGIASIGVSLALLAGLAERRRELATLEAIGAEPRQLLASIAGEASIVGVGGTFAGLATGLLVGASLLAVLAGIFDPPADYPALPLGSMVGLVLAVVAALSAAVLVAHRAVGRIPVLSALRER